MFTPILLKRIFLLIAGLFIMAFGVALSVKANLGTSPISSPPYVLSLIFPWSMGVFTMIMNSLLVLSQLFLLKRDFRLAHALQIPVVLLFSLFTDWTLAMVSARSYVTGYPQQMALCLISILVVAFGVFLEVKAKLLYMAGEGVVIAVVRVFKREFGKVKIGFDCTLVLIALICSLTMLHEVRGIREGTVLAAYQGSGLELQHFYLSDNPTDARVMKPEGRSEFLLRVITAGVSGVDRCVPAAFIANLGNVLVKRQPHCAALRTRVFHPGSLFHTRLQRLPSSRGQVLNCNISISATIRLMLA